MSRFRPERAPRWLKMTLLAVLLTVMRLVILAYMVVTIWLIATGRFEGFV